MPQHERKIGLALGSGAARGMAHIGVLKVLEREGIAVKMISGTSIGALIGALYAGGVSPERMEDVARNVDWRRMAGLVDPAFPSSGLINGNKVTRFISELLPVRNFEELLIPLSMIATDVETGESLVMRRGDLLTALRAAIAFPGIFTPAPFGSRFLVDGGLCNPVPVDAVRALGADAVIGVCAIPDVQKNTTEAFLPPNPSGGREPAPKPESFTSWRIEQLVRDFLPGGTDRNLPSDNGETFRRPPGIFRVCAQSVAIMENQITALRLERDEIDVLIRPKLGGINLLEFHRADEIIRAGEIAAELQLERILALTNLQIAPQSACDMIA